MLSSQPLLSLFRRWFELHKHFLTREPVPFEDIIKAGTRIKINEYYLQYAINMAYGITDSRFARMVHAYTQQFRIDIRNAVCHFEQGELASIKVQEFLYHASSS